MKDLADIIQIDVVDGIFAQPENIVDLNIVRRELPPEKIHVHLMVEESEEALEKWRPIAPRRITIHVEAERDLVSVLTLLLAEGIERGLALGPSTPLDRVLPYINTIDFLLFVSVPPGRSGQLFDPTTMERVRTMRQKLPQLPIGVDGGVTKDLLKPLATAGATSIAVGSALFEAPNPRLAFMEFREMLSGNPLVT
jgi:ribulose-phosphate 3-epimerase